MYLVVKRNVLAVVQVSSPVVVTRVIMSQQHSQLRATYLSPPPASHPANQPKTFNVTSISHAGIGAGARMLDQGTGTRVDQETLQQCLQDSIDTNRDCDKLDDKQHQ